jgi:hypothetical protein
MNQAAQLAQIDQWKSQCASGVAEAVADLKEALDEGVDPAALWWDLYQTYRDESTGDYEIDIRALCLLAATLTMKLAQR